MFELNHTLELQQGLFVIAVSIDAKKLALEQSSLVMRRFVPDVEDKQLVLIRDSSFPYKA